MIRLGALFSYLVGLAGRVRPSAAKPATRCPSRMHLEEEAELTSWFTENECCPDCGGEEFLGGPRGGLSQNMKCSSCGSEFNIARYEGRIIAVGRIHRGTHSPGMVVVREPEPRAPRHLH